MATNRSCVPSPARREPRRRDEPFARTRRSLHLAASIIATHRRHRAGGGRPVGDSGAADDPFDAAATGSHTHRAVWIEPRLPSVLLSRLDAQWLAAGRQAAGVEPGAHGGQPVATGHPTDGGCGASPVTRLHCGAIAVGRRHGARCRAPKAIAVGGAAGQHAERRGGLAAGLLSGTIPAGRVFPLISAKPDHADL